MNYMESTYISSIAKVIKYRIHVLYSCMYAFLFFINTYEYVIKYKIDVNHI
jgi:hypothetical protein